jgi:hypothetical protein
LSSLPFCLLVPGFLRPTSKAGIWIGRGTQYFKMEKSKSPFTQNLDIKVDSHESHTSMLREKEKVLQRMKKKIVVRHWVICPYLIGIQEENFATIVTINLLLRASPTI